MDEGRWTMDDGRGMKRSLEEQKLRTLGQRGLWLKDKGKR